MLPGGRSVHTSRKWGQMAGWQHHLLHIALRVALSSETQLPEGTVWCCHCSLAALRSWEREVCRGSANERGRPISTVTVTGASSAMLGGGQGGSTAGEALLGPRQVSHTKNKGNPES